MALYNISYCMARQGGELGRQRVCASEGGQQLPRTGRGAEGPREYVHHHPGQPFCFWPTLVRTNMPKHPSEEAGPSDGCAMPS